MSILSLFHRYEMALGSWRSLDCAYGGRGCFYVYLLGVASETMLAPARKR